jgi:hypothetical protein
MRNDTDEQECGGEGIEETREKKADTHSKNNSPNSSKKLSPFKTLRF